MKYCFGEPHSEHRAVVEAKNLEVAIKLFKVSELFPEKCVDTVYWKKDHDGSFAREYNSALGRYETQFKIDNPKIDIYENIKDHDWKKVGSIGLQDCINVNFRDLMPSANLLPPPPSDIPGEPSEESTLPVVGSAAELAHVGSKIELRQKHDAIALKKAELERMVQEMNSAMAVLNKELKQKQKVIYIIETFLGIHEEVIQIREGEPAPEDSKLTLYQQKLFMDEEVGIWDDKDGQGIDCKDIEQFDGWICKHYEKFAYEPLSVIVWQVRRNDKEYGSIWDNVRFNQWNKATYFLIRNGSNLYRIWSNVSVSDLLFPTKDEYMNLINEERRWGSERAMEKLQEKHENYLYGLIAIQGMIERTEILGTRLRNNGVNLLSPRGNVDENIRFIRDAETEYWIGDGKPRWSEFLRANRETIRLGSRICLATEKFYYTFSGNDNDKWRCAPYRPDRPPSRGQWYLVEAFKGESKDTYFPHDTNILIRYQPGDCLGWDPYTREDVTRKRRIPWYMYCDEAINFDEISDEEADYYMKSRIDRRSYIKMLPTLHWIRDIKRQEKELEDEFAKMIAGALNWEYNDENRKLIQEAIVWWKLKNKWKRAITIENSTATNMILRKLKKMD